MDLTQKPAPAKGVKRHDVEKDYNGAQRRRGKIRISPTTADVLEDPTLVEDWDDEELRQGRRRASDGTFRGRPPIVVPTACYREIVRRQMAAAQMKMAVHLESAVDTLVAIAESPRADDSARIKAATIIMERIMGKEAQTINLKSEQPLFLGIIQGGIVSTGTPQELDDPDIVDAEVVDEEGDDDGDIIFEE